MKEGDVVPDFELPDQYGETRSLSELLRKGPVVLFFYPAAMTAGCTKEACHFRDVAADFDAAGVQRVGISRDAVDKQKQFSDLHSLTIRCSPTPTARSPGRSAWPVTAYWRRSPRSGAGRSRSTPTAASVRSSTARPT
ncbi:peroxiredoxin [Kribbella sp. NPDC059898]|uniref:peroxiredoxin n=1 Tax=Kribbella sp. NPDC059898 TaxID=3346995 RepID=UPI00364D7E2D